MNNNQKGIAPIVVVIIVIAVLIIGIVIGYYINKFYVVEQPTTPSQGSQTATPPPQTTKLFNWENSIQEIRPILKQELPDIAIESDYSITIGEKADITGDGVPEALVGLGTGGASTIEETLMRIENDKPVVALFRKKDGKISPLIVPVGGSVTHQGGLKMLIDKNAIYEGEWSNFSGVEECNVDVYQWNAQTKNFEFNLDLSNTIKPDFCSKIKFGPGI